MRAVGLQLVLKTDASTYFEVRAWPESYAALPPPLC